MCVCVCVYAAGKYVRMWNHIKVCGVFWWVLGCGCMFNLCVYVLRGQVFTRNVYKRKVRHAIVDGYISQ